MCTGVKPPLYNAEACSRWLVLTAISHHQEVGAEALVIPQQFSSLLFTFLAHLFIIKAPQSLIFFFSSYTQKKKDRKVRASRSNVGGSRISLTLTWFQQKTTTKTSHIFFKEAMNPPEKGQERCCCLSCTPKMLGNFSCWESFPP